MANDDTDLKPVQLDKTIGDLLKEAGVEDAFFLVVVDIDGNPHAFAGPERTLRRIEEGTRVGASEIIRLEHASWVVYAGSARRARLRIGGSSYH